MPMPYPYPHAQGQGDEAIDRCRETLNLIVMCRIHLRIGEWGLSGADNPQHQNSTENPTEIDTEQAPRGHGGWEYVNGSHQRRVGLGTPLGLPHDRKSRGNPLSVGKSGSHLPEKPNGSHLGSGE